MAENWIAIQHTTPSKPEVVAMSIELGCSVREAVGLLIEVWIWADQNTYDGRAECNGVSVTKALLDATFGVPGLGDALEAVGWLRVNKTGIVEFPKFGDHNGRTAKSRKKGNRRVEKHRTASENTGEPEGVPHSLPLADSECNGVSVTKALPQEQEQLQEHNNNKGDAVPACPSPEIVTAFNACFGLSCRLTAHRRKQLLARWRDPWWREHWRQALERAGPSQFLNGSNDRGWRIDLEFFLRPDTVAKIMEGKYDNRNSGTNAQTRRLSNAEQREQANADAFEAVFGSGPGVADALQHEESGTVHVAPIGYLGGRAGAVPD